jgi:uncharacterized membrane protein YfcA
MGEYQFLFLIILGILVGTMGTLIGAGGGFILVPILILIWPKMPPETITSISLAVVFLNALSGSLAYMRMKRVDYKSGLIFALATMPGAFLGARATHWFSREKFNIVFGLLMVFISAYLIFRSRSKAENRPVRANGFHRALTDRQGHQFSYSYNLLLGILISLGVGFISSMLGIGGGIIHVPVMVNLLNFPVHVATATSHFTLIFMSLTGTIEHLYEGTFGEYLLTTVEIGIGVVIGAQIGARLSRLVKDKVIVRGLALALAFVGIRIMFGPLSHLLGF